MLLAAPAAAAPRLVAKVATGRQPCVMVAARGNLWVANYGSSTVARVDPKTNKVTARITVGASPCGLAVGGGALWVDGYGTNAIEKIDMRRLRVVKRIEVGNQPYDVAYAFGAVWSSDNGSDTVSRIDPARGTVVRRLRVPGASGFGVARGYVWVAATHGTKLFRIDPRTNAVKAIEVGVEAPAWLAASDDGVWAAAQSGKVVRVDPASATVVARLDAGAGASDGSVAADGSVWIPLRLEDAVVRIDPATNAVSDKIAVGTRPFVANFAFGDLWVCSFAGTDVWRLRP
jgi:YVTN family beta-propeller protein